MSNANMKNFRKMNDEEIRYWYYNELSEAFAENERKPLGDILRSVDEGKYEICGLFDNKTMLGYATLWKGKDIPLVLLDYLGVSKLKRNGGLGSEILEYLKELAMPMVTESEMPIESDSPEENSIRSRRIEFYKRNGFKPVYEMATCGMRWQALSINAESLPVNSIMKWHKALYGTGRTDVKIPLGADEIPESPYWMK